MSGKGSSLWAQIVAAFWIAGWTGAKFIANPGTIDVQEVIFSGLAIAGCFMPVFFSIILDKVAGAFKAPGGKSD
jgi:hypothetical protein